MGIASPPSLAGRRVPAGREGASRDVLLPDERGAVGSESPCSHAACTGFEVGAIFADAFGNDAPGHEEAEYFASQAIAEDALESGGEDQASERDVGNAVQSKAERQNRRGNAEDDTDRGCETLRRAGDRSVGKMKLRDNHPGDKYRKWAETRSRQHSRDEPVRQQECDQGLIEDDRRNRHDHHAPGDYACNTGVQGVGEAEKWIFLM